MINIPKSDIPDRDLVFEHKVCEDCGNTFATSCGASICDYCSICQDSILEDELERMRELRLKGEE